MYRIAILGDSISDKNTGKEFGIDKFYFDYLETMFDVKIDSFALNGAQVSYFVTEAEQALEKERAENFEYDDILVFGGTNDFNAGVPIGDWYNYGKAEVVKDGKKVCLRKREFLYYENTFKGRLNILSAYLKDNFSHARVFLLTPLHRGFASFSEDNIQPEECYSNIPGFFIDDYVAAVKECANVWAFTCIDLNAESNLFPMSSSFHEYFRDKDGVDFLHPNSNGHLRIAKSIAPYLNFVL
ncbi:MAG: SGNH/GDSL hydrolase family protein [Treponema sp.]|nr:SGNH/GDSL hydrolase family protein [Treponema sp.]